MTKKLTCATKNYFPPQQQKRHNGTTGMVGKYHLKLFPPQPKKIDTTAQLEKCSSSPPVASVSGVGWVT
jgi:hypothetical protein